MASQSGPVLVGVTGPSQNTDALRFALEEARLLGVGVTAVHAVHPPLPPPPPSILITDDSWVEVGHSIVAEARAELEALAGDASVRIATAVHQGAPGPVLGELSHRASRVVLQHQDLSRLRRVVSGSTAAGVAARAHCPVVSVPAGHRGRAETRVIAAGVDGEGGPAPVLEAAFAEAALRGLALRLVHAWRLPPAYSDLATDAARWSAEDRDRITAAAAPLREKHPGVEVDVQVHHDWPADILVGTSETSDLLVVGRHTGLPGLPHRLGSLARTSITHAACPVMVVRVD